MGLVAWTATVSCAGRCEETWPDLSALVFKDVVDELEVDEGDGARGVTPLRSTDNQKVSEFWGPSLTWSSSASC